jgi:HK97 family phage prohead protease
VTNAADTVGRRSAAQKTTLDSFAGQARRQEFKTQLRAIRSNKDGKDFVTLDGHASVTGVTYEMWDFWGPYDEMMATSAFDVTLAANPDVAFLVNHGGMTMARTTSGTLRLGVDDIGLATSADLNPQRGDVSDLVHAVDDGDIDQMSFAFRIVSGRWNEEFTQYTITEVDLDRGDVSAVNYGANPYTTIAARARQVFDGLAGLDGAPLRAARDRADALLAERAPAAESPSNPTGQNAATLRARLELEG